MELDKEKAQSILNTLKRPDFSDSLELAKELAVEKKEATVLNFQNTESNLKRVFLKPKNFLQNNFKLFMALALAGVFALGINLWLQAKKTRDLTTSKPSDPPNSTTVAPQEQSDPNSILKPPTRPQRN